MEISRGQARSARPPERCAQTFLRPGRGAGIFARRISRALSGRSSIVCPLTGGRGPLRGPCPRLISCAAPRRTAANAQSCGGERLNGDKLGKGNFMRPTVLAKVSNKMHIAQEEIFGPVISVIPFKDEAEAIAIANDTPYGLSGSIWTQGLDTAIRVARGLRTGQVVVNRQTGSYVWQMPFGGYKQSGLGRERGFSGIEMYTEIKSVHIKLG